MRDVLASATSSPVHQSIPSPQVDVLIHPSSIRTAPPLSTSDSVSTSPLDAYVQDILTVPASLAGLPALNVHAGLAEDGWPVGVSIVGQWGSEDLVLRVGAVVEKLVRSK
jgi:aspartyl-tRNA(Asn)/glutamyl-tRNA(Gln) amidotransferase subunit A